MHIGDGNIRLMGACMLTSITSSIITYPIDVVKVRLQTNTQPTNNIFQIIFKNRGTHTLYKGVCASVLRNGVFVTSKMYTYNSLKTYIEPNTFLQKSSIGMVSGLIGSVIGTPFDMIMVRIQNNPREYPNMHYTAKHVIANEGVRGLYKGVRYTTIRAMVVTACQFGVYDQMNEELKTHTPLGDSERFVLSAISSAVVTSVVSNPVDLCKSRVMNSMQNTSIVSIIKREGLRAMWKGCSASMARQIPLNLTRFGLLDIFKRMFNVPQ